MTSLMTKAIITTSSITITLTVPATTDLFPPLDSPPLPVLSLPVCAEAPEKKIQLTLKHFDYGKLFIWFVQQEEVVLGSLHVFQI